MIGPARRDSLRNVHFLRSQQSPRKLPPANGGAKACQAPDGFREQNRSEKTRSAQLLLQTRVGRHGQSDSESASPRCIVSNLRAIGIFLYFPDELPNCAGQSHPAYVRNIVSGHFVAFIRSAKEKPRRSGAFARKAVVTPKLRSQLVSPLGACLQATGFQFPAIFSLAFGDRLPLHVAGCVRTAAGERNNVVDDIGTAWPAARSCRWTWVQTLEFGSGAVAADRPSVGTMRDQQTEQDRRNYLNDALAFSVRRIATARTIRSSGCGSGIAWPSTLTCNA
jgi:hypothetical protein